MADSTDDINSIRQKLQDAGATGLENVSGESLSKLTPDSPIMTYVQGLEDQMKAVHQEGKNLLDNDVRLDEKTITPDIQPNHGLDR